MSAPTRDTPLRSRIIESAAEQTARSGWSSVTMAALAEAVDVSRQTVYNEVGSKQALAEAMVLREMTDFLAVVDRAFDDHPSDAVAAIRSAVQDILERAEANPLVRTIVAGESGANTELLPLLTTRSLGLLELAQVTTVRRLTPLTPGLDDGRRAAAAEVIVRTVLSHVMQPSGAADEVARDVAWAAERMLSC